MLVVHHTIKQGVGSRKNQVDSMYAGYGSAVLANSPRETLELRHVDGNVWTLISGKRSDKWGWNNGEQYIKRSGNPELPYWSVCSPDDMTQAMSVAEANETRNSILALIPEDKQGDTSITELVMATGKSDSTIRRSIKELLDAKKIGARTRNKSSSIGQTSLTRKRC